MNKINILIAYPYFSKAVIKKLREMERCEYRLIVDSGAFTAWNTGKKIELDDYCKFLDSISEFAPYRAVQLDVFGDPEKSWVNYKIMKERGYETMPVFTRGESLETLELMYNETDYIMLGGVVVREKNKNYVKWFLNRNNGRKCHWLGFVNMPFIKHYKPESVDSSAWKSAVRFGKLSLYKGNGEITIINKHVFKKKPDTVTANRFEKLGLNPDNIRKISENGSWVDKGYAHQVSTISHLYRSFEVEKKLGTKIYLATASTLNLTCLLLLNIF